MAEKEEQAKPFASSSFQSSCDEEEAISTHLNLRRKDSRFIKCCGCFTAFLLILAVTILVLFFTVFHVRYPEIKINDVKILSIELSNDGNTLSLIPNTAVELEVDVSVKNPNLASFKFFNGTTTIIYGGVVVGEAVTPPGKAEARRTVCMNVTVELSGEKILGVERFGQDLVLGELSMNSTTVIDGKVKIGNIIKKHLIVEVNCNFTYKLKSKQTEQHCKPRFI